MTWTVRLSKTAERDLQSLDRQTQARVVQALRALAVDPEHGPNVQKLTGVERWRRRVGDYRIVYELQADVIIVLVLTIAHRREVYR